MSSFAFGEIAELAGSDLGKGNWLTIDQYRINLFADATGDHQWIHVDEGPARRGLFGTTIAHGYLTLSLISTFLDESFVVVVVVVVTINYGLNRVRFPATAPPGSRLRAHGIVHEVTPVVGGHQMTIRVTVEAEGLDKLGVWPRS